MEHIKPSEKNQSEHIIHIDNRHKMELTGVIRVSTFNEDVVILETSMGILTIKGRSMKVNKLNVENGNMAIQGEINSLVYSTKSVGSKEGLLKKMFK